MSHVEMALLAVGWSGGVGLLGVLALRRSRSRSVRSTLVAVAVLGVTALVAGVLAAARAMFISEHDLAVVVEVAVAAAVVTLLVAFLAGRDVVRDVEGVRRHAAALGEPGTGAGLHRSAADGGPRLRELAEIDGDLRRAAERLDASRQRERALDASRRELVSWVSHDLRTPLAGIRAMAEALEDGVARDAGHYHRQIRREVDRLSSLVDDLFELSRIQSGALSLHRVPVDLRDLVHAAVDPHVAAADSRSVLLRPVEAPAAPVLVRADRSALTRALANLVSNAVRYSASPGTVTVRVRLADGAAVVDVEDTCGGIPAAHRARVFEPGWRAETARTPGRDSAGGLGLAIASGLAHAHDGDLTVHDVPGGCRFSLRVPVT